MSTKAEGRVPNAPVGTMAPARPGSTPDYRSWSAVLMVFLGGAVGTVARESLDLATPAEHLVATTFIINIVGSFSLAVVYTALQERKRSAAFQRRIRLLVGTGFMGGFTTYGSFAVATAAAASRGSVGDAALYAAGSILLGVVAALLGRQLVEYIDRHRRAVAGSEAR
ncbi:fluoride efflux transporter FluC [Herbiconiux ginsengi]|uniref:Fluoride-specific ion channel FluC n=1 Tax=Herbiconiux ginsengi TaxID=381665 RepID=A0A1H3T0R1_9MICO|nr:CrcB family protein [Herbiconiux ginsengi]SDZ43547.1 CrcB protein [Herbiconiux ginsengi]